MASWQFALGPATGGQTAALTAGIQRKVGFKLTDPSEASFNIGGRSPEAANIGELRTDLHCIRDGRLLYRGRIGATTDTVDATTHRIDVRSMDYREMLNRRLMWAPDRLVYGQTDQAAIAWGLISGTQSRPGGDLGIVQGAGQVSGLLRDRSSYKYGDSIGANINELAELVDGFDWDVVPASATALRLDMWHGVAGRGTDRGVVLEYGAGVAAFTRSVAVETYANAVRVTGSDATLVELREAADLADPLARPEGRWDGVFGYPNLGTQAQLGERASWQILDSQVVRPTYDVQLTPGTWLGQDHIWLGDTVRLRVKSGRLVVDTPLRVHEIAVDIGATNDETVTLTLGGPKPDYRRRPSDVVKRLRNLERR